MPLLGDFIAGITSAFGVKPCGACKQRQAAMNAWHARMMGYRHPALTRGPLGPFPPPPVAHHTGDSTGDVSTSLGLSGVDTSGNVSWDAATSSLPPEVRQPVSNAISSQNTNYVQMAQQMAASAAGQAITAYTGSPQLGQWVQNEINSIPDAGSGPGCCVQGNCNFDDYSWENIFGAYSDPTPGTFEELAYTVIRADFDAQPRCPSDPTDPNAQWWSVSYAMSRMPIMLATAVGIWNDSHGSDGQVQYNYSMFGIPIAVPNSGGVRTISMQVNTAVGGFSGGQPSGSDPISVALEAVADIANYKADIAAGNVDQWGFPAGGSFAVPLGASISFTVNNAGGGLLLTGPGVGLGGSYGFGGLLGGGGGTWDSGPSGQYYPPPPLATPPTTPTTPPAPPAPSAATLLPAAAGIGAAIYFANPLLAVAGLVVTALATSASKQ